jgi:hypothetical protein
MMSALDAMLNSLEGASTASASTSTMANPLQQLFSSIDSNGDGSISQGEMESYIGQLGGTQAQADTLYSALGGTSATGISAQQLAQDSAPAHGGHHHHHHHMEEASQSDPSQNTSSTDTGSTTDTTTADESATA